MITVLLNDLLTRNFICGPTFYFNTNYTFTPLNNKINFTI